MSRLYYYLFCKCRQYVNSPCVNVSYVSVFFVDASFSTRLFLIQLFHAQSTDLFCIIWQYHQCLCLPWTEYSFQYCPRHVQQTDDVTPLFSSNSHWHWFPEDDPAGPKRLLNWNKLFIVGSLLPTLCKCGGLLLYLIAVTHTHARARARCGSSGRGIGQSQKPLPSQHTTFTRDKHTCLLLDLNPQSQQPGGGRPTR
jgi:hypothetical protein